MSDEIERDQRGRFLTGNSGGGRKPGARGKLGEQFLIDLQDTWRRHGIAALERVAVEQPEVLIKTLAGLLPKTIDINQSIGVNVADTLGAFRAAVQALGNEPPLKVINGKK